MSCNILIVDDSPILRKVISKVVKMCGIEDERIHEAGNGREALEVLDKVWIDLVLLDLNMPVMNGEEFVQHLRERPELADVPVIIVSTESNRGRLQRLSDLGVTESLHKPFEPEELRRLVPRVLGVKL